MKIKILLLVRRIQKIIILVWILGLYSCTSINNPKDRNTLVFNDNIDSVIQSIEKLNKIITASGRKFYVYAVEDNHLYVEDGIRSSVARNLGNLNDSLVFSNISLHFIRDEDSRDFVRLVAYLYKNHIDRCDVVNNRCIYSYRSELYMADRQKDLMRYIVLSDTINGFDSNRFKVLERHNNLSLLADKDARIYVGKPK